MQDYWDELPVLTKVSSAFFVLGKLTSFLTFITYFVDLQLAKWMLVVYASFITISILLSGIQMFKKNKKHNKPTKQQVEAWAREYKLLEGN